MMQIAASKPDQKTLLETRKDLAVRDLERLFEVTLGLFKWMVTTLLALNGAALLALIGIPELRDVLMRGPIWLFGAGVLLALGGGIAVVLGLARVGEELFAALWRGDSMDVDDYDDFAPASNQQNAATVGAVLLGLSVVCFAGGCIWSGYAATNAQKYVQMNGTGKK